MIGARVKLRPAPKPGVVLAIPEGPGDGPPPVEDCREEYGPDGLLLWLAIDNAHSALEWEAVGARAVARAGTVARLGLDARGMSPAAAVAWAAGAVLAAWRHKGATLEKLDLVVDLPARVEPLWQRTAAAVQGALYARELTALPGNILHPAAFARRLLALRQYGLTVEVLGEKRLRKLGAGALLAVGGAATHGPKLVVLRWRGSMAAPPVAFVGKGITFDTGGVSVKPAEAMERMTSDMAGAAACAGAMLALALRHSPAPAVAVLAIAENALGAASYRPGDVLHTLAGRTVEVVDTDAEGRLVLADALHFAASRLRPRAMLDLATLTGAIGVALGRHHAGIFGNNLALQAHAQAAGAEVGELLWPMPIADSHRADLESEIADLKQCCAGRGQPDACHAAAFLREFAGSGPWAHLDIAAMRLDEHDRPTGFGARLLDRLVARHFEDPDHV